MNRMLMAKDCADEAEGFDRNLIKAEIESVEKKIEYEEISNIIEG